MSIKYTFLSEKMGLEDTYLQVCDDSPNFSVLQYKEKGCLLYSHNRGMYSEDSTKQICQIVDFLRKADELGADLVITPEASVPLSIIHDIINGNMPQPDIGKLWCLGIEGMSKSDYISLVDEWGNKDEIVFIYPKGVAMKKHVNSLLYIFKTESGKLAIVLQAKIGAMRDVAYQHEQADLSLGKEIFILDLNGTQHAHNVLATLICADILNENVVDFCKEFHEKYPIILNIQMNPKPYHREIMDFIECFFGDNIIRKGQILVANWGRETTIREETVPTPVSKGHEDSGSTIYLSLEINHGERSVDSVLTDVDFVVKGINQGQKKGLEYFLSGSYELWKIQEDIHIIYYFLKKGYQLRTGHNILMSQFAPTINKRYKYNINNMLQEDEKSICCDCGEVEEIRSILGNTRASDEVIICADKKCGNCVRFLIDSLVSLCLNEKILDEYQIKNGKSFRTAQTLFQDSKETTKKQKLKDFRTGLEEIKFPERFGEFNENRKFKFSVNPDACIRNGNYKYNLELENDKETKNKRVLAVFLGYTTIEDVCQQYVKLKKTLHEDLQDNILIYYVSTSGIQLYKEPYEQESFLASNNDFSKDIETM